MNFRSIIPVLLVVFLMLTIQHFSLAQWKRCVLILHCDSCERTDEVNFHHGDILFDTAVRVTLKQYFDSLGNRIKKEQWVYDANGVLIHYECIDQFRNKKEIRYSYNKGLLVETETINYLLTTEARDDNRELSDSGWVYHQPKIEYKYLMDTVVTKFVYSKKKLLLKELEFVQGKKTNTRVFTYVGNLLHKVSDKNRQLVYFYNKAGLEEKREEYSFNSGNGNKPKLVRSWHFSYYPDGRLENKMERNEENGYIDLEDTYFYAADGFVLKILHHAESPYVNRGCYTLYEYVRE